uniref:Uncharacterized protein n=1 Tax=Craspedostauros australis TaxID=1486917 RepID=A0A7R9WMW7_9STRA|mmetsp:Transcript_12639/g.34843  ORF Transcript_12639/g.34843 Transcript_12639/m.34843 type:complete len:437 (+) Transcript_12639:235-1545(+)
MSIPIEKRDLGEGWVITCRGADGGDLMLSDVNIRRENLTCQIMGGDTIFFPMLADEDDAESIISATTYESRQYQAAATPMSPKTTSSSAPTATLSSPDVNGQSHAKETRPDSTATASKSPTPTTRASLSSTTSSSKAARSTPYKKRHIENSVLDHIREMLEQAQQFGCWKSGVGGVGQPPTDRYIASVLGGLPVSSVLNCAIELWRNLEIDDDELLEIAIRDVSYQIKLQQEREKSGDDDNDGVDSVDVDPDAQNALDQESNDRTSLSTESVLSKAAPDTRQLLEMQHKKHQQRQASRSSFFGSTTEIPNPDGGSPAQAHSHTRFNPRFDPTVCFLEMKSLSLRLDQFKFCIQKHESKRTIFDPVFQGSGSLIVQNVSMKLRIACVKEHVVKFGSQVAVPVLQLRELDVRLEKVMFKLKDTGADWLLNKVVENVSR